MYVKIMRIQENKEEKLWEKLSELI
jgi:hypothetical protein